MNQKVVIDGNEYVPVSEAVPTGLREAVTMLLHAVESECDVEECGDLLAACRTVSAHIEHGVLSRPKKCQRCEDGPAGELHACPFQEDVNERRVECNCCEECTQQCRDEI